ncbi:MAG: hypothetical protein ACLPR9_04540 [Acidimicrobiales bacterium]|jgi:hypothetical protein
MSRMVSRTPAGARMEIVRDANRGVVIVTVDRRYIDNASHAQRALFQSVALGLADRCYEDGYHGPTIVWGSGTVSQRITAPLADEDEAVRQLLAIEALGATVPSGVGGDR